ncbi:recombinase family protein [Streptomyces tsukubensis]|uniref:recombinase family protein n=1 Tax=Streptomyces tsukubensis TaxID=83656 RepID=UPI00344F0D90
MRTRVLGARRLSRVTDNSTSFDRQELAINVVTEAIGGVVIDWADDPDVSAAKVAPENRPGLGPWLKRPEEFDAIAWWRLDRAVRSMRDMAWLAGWARDHKKRLIFAEGPGGGRLELDMTSPMSELILMILAFAAQMEVQAIEERTQGAAAYLRGVGRWGGGRVPFGRIPVPHPTEDEGWWLARHDKTADVLDKMVELVLAGKSYHIVAAWLNHKYPGLTPANHRRLVADPPREIDTAVKWNPGMVSTLLRQVSLRGWKTVGDEVVRDDVGEPVLMGDVLVGDEMWRRLQAEMDSRMVERQEKSDVHPLLGILHCGSCNGRMYQGWMSVGPRRKVPKRQYRCAARAHGRVCLKPAYVAADPVDRYAETEFLRRYGMFEIVDVITIPGVDHRDEIKELETDVESLAAQLGKLRGAAADAVGRQIQGRSDKLDVLRQQPVVPARTEEVRTGVTYAATWRQANGDAAEQRHMIKSMGMRIVVGETYRGARDVFARLSVETQIPDHVDAEEAAREEAAHQADG